jgi:hypothetical protein
VTWVADGEACASSSPAVDEAPPGSALAEAVLPGMAARVRAARPLRAPQDVPRWMAAGGATARAAATAMAADAAAVRRVGDTVRAVLGDLPTALGWQGRAAEGAQLRVDGLRSQLAVVADRLDVAHDAFVGFAAALDTGHPVLGSAPAAWSAAPDEAGRQAVLRRVEPALRAVDDADVRSARALRDVTTSLERVRATLCEPVALPAAPGGGGLVDRALDAVGSFCAGTVNALASLGNAMGQHPDQTAQLLAGLVLTQIGLSGEAMGIALDTTGVGAVVGVPAGALAGTVVIAGGATAATALGKLVAHAVTDDRVTVVRTEADGGSGSGVAGGAGRADIEHAQYAQRTASRRFSQAGTFRGRLVEDVAADLRSGRVMPDEVPVDVIVRKGRTLILNTRSSMALEEGGVPRSRWNVVDRTGQMGYERRLDRQLRRNGLDSDGVGSVEFDG